MQCKYRFFFAPNGFCHFAPGLVFICSLRFAFPSFLIVLLHALSLFYSRYRRDGASLTGPAAPRESARHGVGVRYYSAVAVRPQSPTPHQEWIRNPHGETGKHQNDHRFPRGMVNWWSLHNFGLLKCQLLCTTLNWIFVMDGLYKWTLANSHDKFAFQILYNKVWSRERVITIKLWHLVHVNKNWLDGDQTVSSPKDWQRLKFPALPPARCVQRLAITPIPLERHWWSSDRIRITFAAGTTNAWSGAHLWESDWIFRSIVISRILTREAIQAKQDEYYHMWLKVHTADGPSFTNWISLFFVHLPIETWRVRPTTKLKVSERWCIGRSQFDIILAFIISMRF